MLDCKLYLENEKLSIKFLNHLEEFSKYNVAIFETNGYLSKVKDISSLHLFINLLKEDLFENYIYEINGLSKEDLNLYIEALLDMVKFQKLYFPNKQIKLTLDIFMKSFILFKRIKNLNPKKILEIGPGTQENSFFFKNLNLINYSTIEVYQPLYMLQHYINFYLYEDKLQQYALYTSNDVKNVKNKQINTYPWWHIDTLKNNSITYDIVLSNSNLLEFSKQSLIDYLKLIHLKLEKNGYFIFHGEGEHFNGNFEYLLDTLYQYKFAPLYISTPEQIDKNAIKFNNKIDKLLLAPFSEGVKKLIDSGYFKTLKTKIYILDDFQKGEYKDIPIISRDYAIKQGFKYGIVFNYNILTRKELINFFKKNSIQNIYSKPIYTKTWGVFINNNHNLFTKYYNKENYNRFFNSNEKVVNHFFSIENDKSFYSSDMIINFLKRKIEL